MNNITLPHELGLLLARNIALSNNASQIKNSPGLIMGWNIINVNTTAVYLKFYDLDALSVTVGITPVKFTLAVPSGNPTNPAIFLIGPDLIPYETFSRGISVACVTGLEDSSTVAPTTPIHASIKYK